MNKRRVVSSIVTGDVTFKTQNEEFIFDVQQLANMFSTTIAFFIPDLDLHWNESYECSVSEKEIKLAGNYSWITARVKEPITSGVHYVELEVTKSTENTILVGLVTKRFFEKGPRNYICQEHGYGLYLPNGKLYHKVLDQEYIDPILPGDKNSRVGLIVNMENRTLTFVVDDVIKPQAFSNLPDEVFVAISLIHVEDIVRINKVDAYKRFRMIHGQ